MKLCLARIFWNERAIDKARAWFERAILMEPDLGDAWAYYYAFECACGEEGVQGEMAPSPTETPAGRILKRAIAAEPRHGEAWTAISKRVENHGLPLSDILRRVASTLRP